MSTNIAKRQARHNALFLNAFRILMVAQVAMIYALTMENVTIERVCSYIFLISSFVFYLLSYAVNKKLRKSDMLFLVLLGYVLLISIIQKWAYGNYVSALVFLSMLTTWRSAEISAYDDKIKEWIRGAFVAQGLLLIYLYFSPVAYKGYTKYAEISEQLTLGFANPNQTGIVLFSTFSVLFMVAKNEARKGRRRLLYLECAALGYMLILTDARTSIIGLILLLYFGLFKKKIKNHTFWADLVICFPLAFVSIYMAMNERISEDVILMGKDLMSGRQEIYSWALYHFTNTLFGNLTFFNFENAHNGLLSILINLGTVGLVIYLFFTITSFNSFYRACFTKMQKLCAMVVLVFFVMACAESATLTGGTIYYVYMFSILLLAHSETKEAQK